MLQMLSILSKISLLQSNADLLTNNVDIDLGLHCCPGLSVCNLEALI